MTKSQKKSIWFSILMFVMFTSGIISLIDRGSNITSLIEASSSYGSYGESMYLNIFKNIIMIPFIMIPIAYAVVLFVLKKKNKLNNIFVIIGIALFGIQLLCGFISACVYLYREINYLSTTIKYNGFDLKELFRPYSIESSYVMSAWFAFVLMGSYVVESIILIFNLVYVAEKLDENTFENKKLSWTGILLYTSFVAGLNFGIYFINSMYNLIFNTSYIINYGFNYTFLNNIFMAIIYFVCFILAIIILIKVLTSLKNFTKNKVCKNDSKIAVLKIVLVFFSTILIYFISVVGSISSMIGIGIDYILSNFEYYIDEIDELLPSMNILISIAIGIFPSIMVFVYKAKEKKVLANVANEEKQAEAIVEEESVEENTSEEE